MCMEDLFIRNHSKVSAWMQTVPQGINQILGYDQNRVYVSMWTDAAIGGPTTVWPSSEMTMDDYPNTSSGLGYLLQGQATILALAECAWYARVSDDSIPVWIVTRTLDRPLEELVTEFDRKRKARY